MRAIQSWRESRAYLDAVAKLRNLRERVFAADERERQNAKVSGTAVTTADQLEQSARHTERSSVVRRVALKLLGKPDASAANAEVVVQQQHAKAEELRAERDACLEAIRLLEEEDIPASAEAAVHEQAKAVTAREAALLNEILPLVRKLQPLLEEREMLHALVRSDFDMSASRVVRFASVQPVVNWQAPVTSAQLRAWLERVEQFAKRAA